MKVGGVAKAAQSLAVIFQSLPKSRVPQVFAGPLGTLVQRLPETHIQADFAVERMSLMSFRLPWRRELCDLATAAWD